MNNPVITACMCTGEPRSILDEAGQPMLVEGVEPEVWMPIPGWEGLYEASNHARVRSLDRLVNNGSPGGKICTGRVLTQIKVHGYWTVSLKDKPRATRVGVHRLMLLAFRYSPGCERLYACHNNGRPDENRLGNLRWDTNQGNMRDKRIHGTEPLGEKRPNAKLTESAVREIRSSSLPPIRLAEKFGVSTGTIQDVTSNRSWTHVV